MTIEASFVATPFHRDADPPHSFDLLRPLMSLAPTRLNATTDSKNSERIPAMSRKADGVTGSSMPDRQKGDYLPIVNFSSVWREALYNSLHVRCLERIVILVARPTAVPGLRATAVRNAPPRS